MKQYVYIVWNDSTGKLQAIQFPSKDKALEAIDQYSDSKIVVLDSPINYSIHALHDNKFGVKLDKISAIDKAKTKRDTLLQALKVDGFTVTNPVDALQRMRSKFEWMQRLSISTVEWIFKGRSVSFTANQLQDFADSLELSIQQVYDRYSELLIEINTSVFVNDVDVENGWD